ncbi:MAG: helix-turn-helix transcriptional regulator [Bacillota bacterium]|nr:helix-turn-helix transcriptional regulator [Bacillota bacterium]
MDYLTELITCEIKKQYRSVRQFAFAIGVPQTTVVSALKKGVSGTGYDTVLKMCKTLNIRLADYETPIPLDDEVVDMVNMYSALDEKGMHTVRTVILMEYNRCIGEEVGYVAAYGGKTAKTKTAKSAQGDAQEALRSIKSK